MEEDPVLENVIIEDVEIPKKPKIIKGKKVATDDYYFSNEIDSKILKEYEDVKNDIMTISKKNSIRPWEVVSVLYFSFITLTILVIVQPLLAM